MDRFLSVCIIKRQQLQLLGATCLLIASKLRSANRLGIELLCTYTDNSVSYEHIFVSISFSYSITLGMFISNLMTYILIYVLWKWEKKSFESFVCLNTRCQYLLAGLQQFEYVKKICKSKTQKTTLLAKIKYTLHKWKLRFLIFTNKCSFRKKMNRIQFSM